MDRREVARSKRVLKQLYASRVAPVKVVLSWKLQFCFYCRDDLCAFCDSGKVGFVIRYLADFLSRELVRSSATVNCLARLLNYT